MNNLSYDLVIFDCDGVLVESEEIACRVYVDILAEHGHHLDYNETLHKFYGLTLGTRLKISAQEFNWSPPDDFMTTFFNRQRALSERELQTIPHIHELIESLRIPFCVASNGVRTEIEFRLKFAKLLHHFQTGIFSGAEVPHPKPAPDVYLAAAHAFGVTPARCVVIEDSVIGVTAAVAAGMNVYGRVGFVSSADLQAAGAIPFTSMLEARDIFAGYGIASAR